ncbi:succinate dehydrogenase cytochrome b subunit [Georgenia faecalis]|uniref:Succinate dehydrogenase cytochrome b subunit n=1 Tax=Georgenia faecalis TaxID=2483799 RepID=A0ABV9D6E1_9MICO|nr:succinate dehydrogenase cytochrome b subunit [Georgenia faecalis]
MSITSTRAVPLAGRRTTVALKIVMAVTGLLFVAFVLAHMYGNLKMFSGQEAFNSYAEHLRELGDPILPYGGFLWIMRVGLIVSLVLHVAATVILWRRAGRARGTRYVKKKSVGSSLSSRTMRWGGLALLAFIVFHILQFTTLTVQVGGPADNPYGRMVAAFEVWWLLLLYVVAMVALGMHLRHGIWSATQTLGLSNRRREPALRLAAVTVALITVVGFLAPPFAVFFGLID